MKCYIDNFVCLWSCIRNVNKHFWCRCRGGSQYLLSIYRLHRIILTSMFSLTDLSATLWLFLVVILKCFVGPKSQTIHHSFPMFTSRFISIGLMGFLLQQVSKKSNQMDPSMSFKQLVDKTLTEAWERYHAFVTDLTTVSMEDSELIQGFNRGMSQEAKEHIDALAGGTFFMLNVILDKLQNRLSGPALPTVPCILVPFKVHHALCNWGATMNILPKIVYDFLDEDPLVPTPHQL
jgi:hypothetical protein